MRRLPACLVSLAMLAPAPTVLAQAPAPRGAVLQVAPDEPAGRRVTPLSGPLLARLRTAAAFLASGQLDSARVTLERLLVDVPHHPQVLALLTDALAQRQAWGEIERLAVRERTATRDSTLLAEDLATALERGGRPAAAAQVAVEAWVASPILGEWALGTLARLAPATPRAVRDALRRALAPRLDRADLARGLARLDWSAGDDRAALRGLADADHAGARPPARWSFAEELLRGGGTSRDSAGATDALLDLAGDRAPDMGYRLSAAQRAWDVFQAQGAARAGALRIARALEDVPADRWDTAFLVGVARTLRLAGRTTEARTLLTPRAGGSPAIPLERALADLRDGPPARALPALREVAGQTSEGAWRYAEALFFAARTDSAKVWYEHVTADAASVFAGAAYDRLFLIEDADPPTALPLFGELAYEEWRGESRRAEGLADSLMRSLPRGALWAQAALRLAALREDAGDARDALAPLLAVADSLPGDRMAPLARQRLGDLYLDHIHDEAQALAQYEECLARYPRAWNAAEVRRRLDALRRARRF